MIKGLPERLKSQRLKHNLSQKVVAERLNISQAIIAGYETGYRTPSTENLLSLAYLYHCSTDYLLGKTSNGNDSFIDASGLTKEQVACITKLIDSIAQPSHIKSSTNDVDF